MPQENKIKLSVVIPVYNEAPYLPSLFEDLIKYFDTNDTEIIIVDDGSNDGSTEIINDFKLNKNYNFDYKTIRLDINSGKGKALRIGIKNSCGEYILLQDADLELDMKDSLEMYQMIQGNEIHQEILYIYLATMLEIVHSHEEY